MCDPASIAYAVVTVATTIYGHEQQRQQASAANKAAEIQFKVEAKRARQEAMDRGNQLTQDALAESERLNRERTALALEALREQAAIRTASAEGGIGGISKMRSFLSADVQEDLARSDLARTERNSAFNIAQAKRGIENNRIARHENAFLTRQANTQQVPGIGDLAVGLVSGNAKGIGKGSQYAYDKLNEPSTTDTGGGDGNSGSQPSG